MRTLFYAGRIFAPVHQPSDLGANLRPHRHAPLAAEPRQVGQKLSRDCGAVVPVGRHSLVHRPSLHRGSS